MNSYFNNILEITLPITVFTVIMLLLSPLIKRALVVKWRYYIWFFISLRLLLPFKIRLFNPVVITVSQSLNKELALPASVLAPFDTKGIAVSDILFYVWLCGIVAFLLFHIIFYLKFKRDLIKWHKKPQQNTLEAFSEYGISQDRLKICRLAGVPMVFGIFRPIIILPHESYTENELRIILRHEVTHYKNKDILYKLLLLLACAVHWFNPVVHKMYKTAVRDLELNCDNEVVENKDDEFRTEYCHVIVSSVRSGRKRFAPCSTSFEASKKVLYERLLTILDKSVKRRGILLLVIAAGFVAVCGGMIEYASAKVVEETPVISEVFREIKRPVTPSVTKEPLPSSSPAPPTLKPTENAPKSTPAPTHKAESTAELPTVFADEALSTPTPKPKAPDNATDFSLDKNSINITVLPEMKNYVFPFEFTGSDGAELIAGCTNGSCGFSIINSKTGELVADNSDGTKTNITTPLNSESSYYICVTSQSSEPVSLYVYQK